MSVTIDNNAFSDLMDTAIYKNASGLMTGIRFMLDTKYSGQGFGETQIASNQLTALVFTSDVTDITNDATITYDGTVYKVIEIIPDGTGLTSLTLSME